MDIPSVCYPEGKKKLGTSPLTVSKPHFLLLFILIYLISPALQYRMDVCVCKNRVTGRVWCRFMRWLEVCLDPSSTGGARGPTFLRWGLPSPGPPLPLLSQLRAGVTVPALNASSWPRSGWHVATGLTQSLKVVYSLLASSKLKCQDVCLWRNNRGRCERRETRESKGNKHWGPCFSQPTSSLQYFTLLFLLFSLPLLILVGLFLVREELLFIWTSIAHKCK